MKRRILFSLALIMCSIGAYAQNVGIGTTTPAQKLDIKSGRIRFSGDPSVSNVQGIEFTKTDGLTLNGFLGKYNDSTIGFYGFTGAGWGLLFNNTNGNLGLQGNSNPRTPLSFSNAVGNKLSIYDNGNGTYYGIGLQAAKFQFYVPTAAQAFVFGTGSSAAFTENMRISGDGKVGIGTNNPTEKLDVNGNINTIGTVYSTGASVGGNVYLAGNLSCDGGAFVSDNLDVNGNVKVGGNLKISGGSPGTGKVLTSDASGNASWAAPTPKIGFAAGKQYDIPDTNFVYVYSFSPYYNAGNAFDPASGKFTAPVAGFYHFDASVYLQNKSPSNANIRIHLSASIGTGFFIARNFDPNEVYQMQFSGNVYLQAGETAQLAIGGYVGNASRFSVLGGFSLGLALTYFSGYLVH